MSQSELKVEKEDPGTGYMFGDTRTEGDFARMGAAALETIRPYTVENMVQAHREIFDL